MDNIYIVDCISLEDALIHRESENMESNHRGSSGSKMDAWKQPVEKTPRVEGQREHRDV